MHRKSVCLSVLLCTFSELTAQEKGFSQPLQNFTLCSLYLTSFIPLVAGLLEMVEKLAVFGSLLKCPVCQETFTDPVSLSCKHSFCSEGLQTFWEDSQSKNCPLCRRRSSKDLPDVNFALKQLADSFADRPSGPSEKTESSTTVEEVKMELVCSKHKERKMFCEDEQRALCAVCEFSLHKDHKLVPVEEAVRQLKKQLKYDLKALKNKKKKCIIVEETYREVINYSTMEVSSAEKNIRAEYDNRRRLLKEEEKSRVEAMRNAVDWKRTSVIREMEKVQEQMSSLSESIDEVEEELQKGTVAFLNSYKGSESRARVLCFQPDPQVPYALINMVKHLDSLSLKREQKMENIYHSPYTQSPYTASWWFDPMYKSTIVGRTSPRLLKKLKGHSTPKTFLVSEGFSSGHHGRKVDVKVGDHPELDVGVAKKSVSGQELTPRIDSCPH